MSLAITYINDQYKAFSYYYVKAYDIDNNLPKTIFYDDSKTFGSIMLKINEEGFFISEANALVIPHIEGYYNLYFYKEKFDADNDIQANGILMADSKIAEISGETLPKANTTRKGVVKFGKASEIKNGTDFAENIVLSEDNCRLTGELAAEDRKANPEQIANREQFLWMSPAGFKQAITDENLIPPNPQKVFKIGDVVFRDRESVIADYEFLINDGSDYDPIEYPELSVKDGYFGTGSIDNIQFDKTIEIPESIGDNIVNNGIKSIRINDNLLYGVRYNSGGSLNQVLKSTDGGQNWTDTGSSISAAYGFYITMSFNQNDKILIGIGGTYGYYFVFDINTDSFTSELVRPTTSAYPIDIHWNSNLNKWVIFASKSSAFYTITTEDGINFKIEGNLSLQMSTVFSNGSGGYGNLGKGSYEQCYYNGKYYYMYRISSLRRVYYTDENELNKSNLLFSETPTSGFTSIRNVSNPIITDEGKFISYLGYKSVNGGYEIEFLKSDNLIDFTKFTKVFNSGEIIGDLSRVTINYLGGNSILMLIDNSGETSNSTVIFTNDLFINCFTNILFSTRLDLSTVLNLKEIKKLLITKTVGRVTLIKIDDFDLILTPAGFKTLDMSNQFIGDIVCAVKARNISGSTPTPPPVIEKEDFLSVIGSSDVVVDATTISNHSMILNRTQNKWYGFGNFGTSSTDRRIKVSETNGVTWTDDPVYTVNYQYPHWTSFGQQGQILHISNSTIVAFNYTTESRDFSKSMPFGRTAIGADYNSGEQKWNIIAQRDTNRELCFYSIDHNGNITNENTSTGDQLSNLVNTRASVESGITNIYNNKYYFIDTISKKVISYDKATMQNREEVATFNNSLTISDKTIIPVISNNGKFVAVLTQDISDTTNTDNTKIELLISEDMINFYTKVIESSIIKFDKVKCSTLR